jgi:cold shock protein
MSEDAGSLLNFAPTLPNMSMMTVGSTSKAGATPETTVREVADGRCEAVVRVWSDTEGWGVLDAPEVPGGCWTHFSQIEVDGIRILRVGQRVRLAWKAPGCHGYDYRAVWVTPCARLWGQRPAKRTSP